MTQHRWSVSSSYQKLEEEGGVGILFASKSHCKRPLTSVEPPMYCVSVESYVEFSSKPTCETIAPQLCQANIRPTRQFKSAPSGFGVWLGGGTFTYIPVRSEKSCGFSISKKKLESFRF